MKSTLNGEFSARRPRLAFFRIARPKINKLKYQYINFWINRLIVDKVAIDAGCALVSDVRDQQAPGPFMVKLDLASKPGPRC
jgi:hypothetical protein